MLQARPRLVHEFQAIGVATLYFGCWLALLISIKHLILSEYHIPFHGWVKALVGTLVISKAVLVLEHVPLGGWVAARPAWVDVVLRTALYTLGVLVVLLVEKAFDSRHDLGGFGSSLLAVYRHPEINHVWANLALLAAALLGYNVLAVVRLSLGEGHLFRLFLAPLPEEQVKLPAP